MRFYGASVVVVAVGFVAMTVGPVRAGMTSEGPRVTARAALVMDAGTGEVLWERDADTPLSPASTTKVMTAILALESGRLADRVAASAQACAVVPSKVNLRPGQELRLQDLVYAILLNSANDASVAIAEHLAGSEELFGARMTARAREIGARNTRFVNPHGLTADGHYSTARDLALIFRHALRVPGFREIVSTKSAIVDVTNGARKIALHSHNRLLDSYRIPVVGKTGFTTAAKKCFVGAGTYDGREVIVALLGSSDLWGDARRLIEFGFGDELPAAPLLRRSRVQRAEVRAEPSKPAVARTVTRPIRRSVGTAAGYAIHVGTFNEMERARRLQHALGRRGYAAGIDRVPSGRGKGKRVQYRVEVGPYANRRQAESVVRTMAGQVDLDARIVQR